MPRASTGRRSSRGATSRPRTRTPTGSRSARARSASISTPRAGGTSRPRRSGRRSSAGDRVMHVEWVANPTTAIEQIRLRPEEYRRLWAAIRSDFRLDAEGRPSGSATRAMGASDAFYWATGKATAIKTCNSWTAGPPADRRRPDEPLAAVRPGARLALPEVGSGEGSSSTFPSWFRSSSSSWSSSSFRPWSSSALVRLTTRPLSFLPKLDERDFRPRLAGAHDRALGADRIDLADTLHQTDHRLGSDLDVGLGRKRDALALSSRSSWS